MKAQLTVDQAHTQLEQAKRTLQAAEQDVSRAAQRLDQQRTTAQAKTLREAKIARDDAREVLAAAERAHAAAIAAEAERQLAEQWNVSREDAREYLAGVHSLEQMAAALAAEYARVDKVRERTATRLPWRPPSLEIASPLWSAHALATLLFQQLYVSSDGRLGHGRFGMSAWELAQGPSLFARARENITRALNHAPSNAAADLPPAA